MLRVEDWKTLSSEAKKYYDENREHYDGMAKEFAGEINVPAVIEMDCKAKKKLPKTWE